MDRILQFTNTSKHFVSLIALKKYIYITYYIKGICKYRHIIYIKKKPTYRISDRNRKHIYFLFGLICDGGWSKIIHTHSYNAMGLLVLLLGQKLKNCYILAFETSIATSVRELNQWPARAIEADIIVEGFLNANEYGIRYMTLIADRDSSTYAKIQEEAPVWGAHVKKGECTSNV